MTVVSRSRQSWSLAAARERLNEINAGAGLDAGDAALRFPAGRQVGVHLGRQLLRPLCTSRQMTLVTSLAITLYSNISDLSSETSSLA